MCRKILPKRSCSNFKNVSIPDSVTSIEWSAFYGCTSLTSVLIPDSVTSIDSSAFDSDDLIIKFQGTKAQWDKATKEYGWTLNYKKSLLQLLQC